MLRRHALVLVLGLLGCGGKAVIDGPLGAGGAAGASSTSSTTSSGDGGCDAASHTIDIADFNVSCAGAADCMAVFAGNFCGGCWCPFSAINVADKAKYEAEALVKGAGVPSGGYCHCPASTPICEQGECATQVP
jgi:hypothetical protein